MNDVLAMVQNHTEGVILIFARVSALVFSSPIFGRKAIPTALKVGFCLLLTYIVAAAGPVAPIVYSGIWHFVVLVCKELMFGLILGYATALFFTLTHTAGYVMDMQMGFGMANIYDPQSNLNVPMTGNLLNIILLVAFFGSGGHLQLAGILLATFQQVAPGAVVVRPEIGLVALEVFALAFVMALNVAMPLLASGMLGELVMGIAVRAMPQMNMFVVGIPLKILLGFAALLLVLPVYVRYTGSITREMFGAIERLFAGMVAP